MCFVVYDAYKVSARLNNGLIRGSAVTPDPCPLLQTPCRDLRHGSQPYSHTCALPCADVGDEARLGHIMKLTGNFYIASAIELIAEGMNMGERAGLSRDTLLEFYSYMLPGVHC
jgi:hypothetical protein